MKNWNLRDKRENWHTPRKREVYVRRDMRSKYGILRNSDRRPKWYVSKDVYEKFSKKEKKKWVLFEITE